MKTKIIISIVALSLVLVTKSAFAKTQTLTNTPKQEARATITQIREEKKIVISELKLKKVEVVYKAIKMGLEKRHTALLKIKAKLDARITKNPMNKDKTQASVELAKFTTAEAKYQADMKTLDIKFETLKNSTKTSEVVKGLKDTVNLIREDLNNIKKVLTAAVTALAKAPKLEVTKTK
ncbi:MAG: hypothetical protein PHE32_00470 [Candidatus Shapirobacteria bacterium]|nr:hypothetical protein [Candidatus Shapirobacteria bacterium]MDD4410170.1 hypothetical protein [Candidatus Shapirobacteria bacterium]